MKRTSILFGALLLLAAVPTLAGGIGGGVAYWDAEEGGDDNGLALRLEIDLGSTWNLDLRAGFLDGHAATVGSRNFLLEATPIDLGVSYGWDTGGSVTPYAGGGLSYVNYDVQVLDSPEEVRVADEPGWYAVIGVELRAAPRLGLYLEGLYRQNKAQVEGDGLDELDKADIDFAGPAANVGLMLTW